MNYAHITHQKSRELNSRTGLEVGGFNQVKQYTYNTLDKEFKEKNKNILSQRRGAGYWLWKPYVILDTLRRAKDGDMVFYCDAGCSFVGSFNDYFFDICERDEKGIILFMGAHPHSSYTKRDCFYYMDCEHPKYWDALQLTATFQLVRKNDFSMDFYEKYVAYCEDERIISDKQNVCGLPNFPDYIDHRHDQSVLTNLQIKYNITCYQDPSQWGDFHGVREEGFRQLINHHRSPE